MSETPSSDKPVKECLVCKTTSQNRVLISAEYEDRPVWVCVGCLPMLIHGAH